MNLRSRLPLLALISGALLFTLVPAPAHAEGIVGQAVSQLSISWPWYLVRASGLVAAGCLLLIVLSGIGFITGHTFKLIQPIAGWATHRALGIAMTVSLLVHMTMLLFDRFVPFSLAAVLVPFVSTYRPAELAGVSVGSIYVAYGVIAFYAITLIVLTSLIWIEQKVRIWRLIHFLSYLVAVLVFFHALMLGTDLQHGILRTLWIGAGTLFLVAVVARLWRAGTLDRND